MGLFLRRPRLPLSGCRSCRAQESKKNPRKEVEVGSCGLPALLTLGVGSGTFGRSCDQLTSLSTMFRVLTVRARRTIRCDESSNFPTADQSMWLIEAKDLTLFDSFFPQCES